MQALALPRRFVPAGKGADHTRRFFGMRASFLEYWPDGRLVIQPRSLSGDPLLLLKSPPHGALNLDTLSKMAASAMECRKRGEQLTSAHIIETRPLVYNRAWVDGLPLDDRVQIYLWRLRYILYRRHDEKNRMLPPMPV